MTPASHHPHQVALLVGAIAALRPDMPLDLAIELARRILDGQRALVEIEREARPMPDSPGAALRRGGA